VIFTISRAAVVARGASIALVSAFDALAEEQQQTDLAYPNGWTEAVSVDFYKKAPRLHQWLMHHGIILPDNVARIFPHPTSGTPEQLQAFVPQKLPSQMTKADWQRCYPKFS
jgi:hypothetical protein